MDDLINNYQIDKHKLFFVPLGVDKDFWTPVNIASSGNILAVGKDNGRDYKTLFAAASQLPDEQFVVVCGKWNIEGLDIPDNLKVIYGLPIKELKETYQSARMLLLITHNDQYTDASDCSGQTVLLDAMSSALPIIATRKQYLSDYAKDKEEVLKVNFYDAGDIVAKIKMLSDQKLAWRLAKAARSKVISCFSSRQMAENLSQIFKQLS